MTITLGVQMTTIDCGACGGSYAINAEYDQEKRRTGGSWHCPYCQVGWGYSGKGTNAQLQRELAQEKAKRDQAEAAARDAKRDAEAAQKREAKARKALARSRKRVGNGVCPCCNRSFTELQRHMATKHPEYATA